MLGSVVLVGLRDFTSLELSGSPILFARIGLILLISSYLYLLVFCRQD
jgi:hypothetical protein